MWRALGSAQQPLLGLAERGFRLAEPAEGPTPATPFAPLPPTPPAEADAALAALDARALAWRATPCAQRAALLRETIRTTLAAAEAAAAAGAAYKGSAAGVGDELFRWAVVAGALREYAEAMDAGGAPRPHALAARAVPAGAGSDGSGEAGADAGGAKSPQTQVVVDAFPLGLEALLFGGFRGELWLEPGAPPAQGAVYRAKAAAAAAGAAPRAGGAALVLAAGNEIAVVATDVLHVLLAVDSPVACKMNPANEVLGPHLRRAFQPLVDYGVLEFLYGGAAEGAALAADARVEALHLTGSAATFDALVWRGAPKSESAPPPFPKPVHAELGCVTPYIVCPGPWTPEELEFHAESVATGLTHNAGHNCLAAEVVVLDAEWPLRGAFLAALRRRLAAAPARAAFYPGAAAERAAFLARFPDAEALGAPGAEADLGAGPGEAARERARARPWLLKTGLAPGEAAVSAEHWCGVLQVSSASFSCRSKQKTS
jgi:acyl-CoA reductase-like NAD-dependent aldehyde dehydrogenase